jgi:hypothetical protein
MPRELTSDEKKRFVSLKYFGTTDNPLDDVNPCDSLNEFLENSVGSLNWGIDATVRRNSKMRFAYNFNQLLNIYRIVLSPADIMTIIDDEDQTNQNAVDEFINHSSFPLF